ncbi:MAG TPA: carbamate kinase [Clostridiales bacterium]|jgi:carbamate kinase|nr:carbamate kinase [Clostridiales bacterium]
MSELVVVALGGNALQQGKGPADADSQLQVVRQTAAQLVEILKAGHQLAVVHGNGPQVGRIVLQNEAAANITPPMPFDVCGAMSQGMIGYHIQQALGECMAEAGLPGQPVTLVSQVLVDAGDPAFTNPTKPIGPFYTEEEAQAIAQEKGYTMKEDAGRGWRRVVASPQPLAIVELPQVKTLLDAGFVPIAAGGGGIPVTRQGKGYRGIAAVIDKDLAAWRMAASLGAKTLLILTEVEQACLYYGRPEQQALGTVSAEQMRTYMEEGHFAAGSMGPKVEAALRFVEGGAGRTAVITSLDKAVEGAQGFAGTIIKS